MRGIKIFELEVIKIANFIFYSLGLFLDLKCFFNNCCIIYIGLNCHQHKYSGKNQESSLEVGSIEFDKTFYVRKHIK